MPYQSHLPWIVALLLLALLLAALVSMRADGKLDRDAGGRVCPGCGESHPGFARFCRRCGRILRQ